jgi:uncharacterized membrane protein
MSPDLALIVFDHTEGAERAYAAVLESSGPRPWLHELAFVEHHRHDHIVVRGTFAGRYVDIDDRGDVIGRRTADGALAGAAAGLLFGPPGFAVGLVAGATAGGLSEEERAGHLHNAFVDELRATVPERSSALLVMAAPEHVDALLAALAGRHGTVVRHGVEPEAAAILQDAVSAYPLVTPA